MNLFKRTGPVPSISELFASDGFGAGLFGNFNFSGSADLFLSAGLSVRAPNLRAGGLPNLLAGLPNLLVGLRRSVPVEGLPVGRAGRRSPGGNSERFTNTGFSSLAPRLARVDRIAGLRSFGFAENGRAPVRFCPGLRGPLRGGEGI